MSASPGKQPRSKIEELVPSKYGDFLTYCSITGKVFADELTPVDYIAYRSQFGREKGEVKALRAIIETTALPEGDGVPAPADEAPAEKTDGAAPDAAGESSAAASPAPDPSEAAKDRCSRPRTFDSTDDSKRTYADLLGLNAKDFAGISVEKGLYSHFSVSLSVRSVNALKRNDYATLDKLLLLTPAKLRQIKNLGAKSVREIETALMDISQRGPVGRENADTDKRVSFVRKKVLRPIVDAMLSDEPYSLESLSDREKVYFASAVEAANTLGKDLCISLLHGDNRETVEGVLHAFTAFYQKVFFQQAATASAEKAVANWAPVLSAKRLRPFLRLYCALQKAPLSNAFRALMVEDATVTQYAELVKAQLEGADGADDAFGKELAAFQTWMNGVDLIGSCQKAFDRSGSKTERVFEVLSARTGGKTLTEIGQKSGLTRERVRQLEKKALDLVCSRLSENQYDLFGLVCAYRNGDTILREAELLETVGPEYGSLIWYCATRTSDKGKTYLLDTEVSHYDSALNAVVVYGAGAPSHTDEPAKVAEAFIVQLPDLMETSALNAKLTAYAEKSGLPEERLMLAAARHYQQAGCYSYRGRLTVIQMCDCVLKSRFPNGYKIADETDGARFASTLITFFGEKGRMTPRAIDAKMMSLGVLIDRGKYIHPDYFSVDRSIIEKVFAYIEASPKSALTYFELFAALEDLFKGTAITNRYALQGAMKLYHCPYPSHRDYITKEADVNVADELNAFVEAAGTVHKSELLAAFPGWKSYNLEFVLPRCPEVIRLDDGYFMHASRLSITEEDRRSIKAYLDTVIHEVPISARYLLDAFMNLFPEFMIRNDIQRHGKLYGTLQYMFPNDYHFSRSYIAKEDHGEITSKSVLLKHLEGVDTIELDDFIDLCKQSSISYVSVAALLDRMQPELIRVDAITLMRIEKVGLREEMYADISALITEAVAAHNGYLAAGSVEDFSWYPTLNVPWTPFLLESAANLLPGGVNVIKMVSSSSEVPHSIFVCDAYADDDWSSLLVKLLKAEHAVQPFLTKTDVLKWLQAEGLCNVTYPAFLDTENHVYFDETGKLRIE